MNTYAASLGSSANRIGPLLREWRTVRRLSQLDLALSADVSARHLSYVETGKAQPSRDMIGRLANVLDLPLRERNALLLAAGFAPTFRESALTAAEMAPVRRALDFILEHQNPYPAFVMTRHWDVLMTNRALPAIFDRLKPAGPKHGNILRQVFDPEDMRPLIANWEEVAGDLIRHIHGDIMASPADTAARALMDEVLAYPEVPPHWRNREFNAAPLPMLSTIFRSGDLELRFFSTLTVFGTSRDVTIDELRIECMFPVDEATAQRCREIVRA
ncbi:helix-turn-helix transcriptional regulator [Povalibacter sp.]|uniref:helix-turn-helix domain-containing protein n=1 Tax=Povalibacter sp. TaxID=1962978 RepID=UPI002F40DF79